MSSTETMPDAATFSRSWVTSWNSNDVEGVLQHFHDDVVFTSPVAASLMPDTGGVVRGKDALRAYWRKAVQLMPSLHFKVEAVHAGVSTLVIQYRNQTGLAASEVLTFRGGKVQEGHGAYSCDTQNSADGERR